jgi:glycosyltransferase involved in cell wall biosynthesis
MAFILKQIKSFTFAGIFICMEYPDKPIIDVIIPALNEEESIGYVLQNIPSEVREVIVCDNGSSDQTADVAKSYGAKVVEQPVKGYGNSCLKGLDYVSKKMVKPDIVVFLDADYSDHPDEMHLLIRPILEEGKDLVIGSRALGVKEKGSMKPQQIFGNWLATKLIDLFYHYRYTDLGPFRAIRYNALLILSMRDRNFGWTVEMQIKAIKKKLACAEVPVSYRKRVGVSKVTGTLKGTILAGYKIIWTIFKLL